MSTLLEAEHLTKIFTQRGKESFKAVDDVSFTLKPGETLGIVGGIRIRQKHAGENDHPIDRYHRGNSEI